MRIYIITAIIFSIIIIFILCKTIFSTKPKIKIYNNNETFKQTQEKDDITFEKIKCYYDGKESLISYIISNKSNETIELKNYKVIVKDKEENVITNIFVNSNTKLAPNEEKTVKNRVLGRDLSNAYKMDLIIMDDENTD